MPRLSFLRRAAWAGAVVLAPVVAPAAAQEGPALTAFTSRAELQEWLRERMVRQHRRDDSVAAAVEKARRAACPAGGATTTLFAARAARGEAVITGMVRGAMGEPIQGVEVHVIATSLRTGTDSGGRYRLTVQIDSGALSLRLRWRAIGYLPGSAAITIRARDSLDTSIRLCADIDRIEEMVVDNAVVQLQEGVVTGDGVTNVQHAGVDEGGIVKRHGDHLVILRRGRLFTVAIGGDSLHPVSMVDAFGPDVDPLGTWYDEMLIGAGRIVVIGYSYRRAGTEIGLFRIDHAGRIRYESTWHLRGWDYYSSRNYASRLIGTRLIFYAPGQLHFPRTVTSPLAVLPALRRWRQDSTARFEAITVPHRVYRVRGADDAPSLHTVTTCDLAQPELVCDATVVIGGESRTFYVSPTAVYVWTGSTSRARGAAGSVIRLPLDSSEPGALGVRGQPIDQLSFLERDSALHVLVRDDAQGDAMWAAEQSAGAGALLRIPLAELNALGNDASPRWYTALPLPSGWSLQNRFVGEHLLYGAGSGWGERRHNAASLYVVRYRDAETTRLEVPHGVDRIEAMGRQAVVIGTGEQDLVFSGVELGVRPQVRQEHRMAGLAQGETRSHGFYYRPDSDSSGTLAMPVRSGGDRAWRQLREGSASVTWLRHTRAGFQPLGDLRSSKPRSNNDGCRASCVDWYGNARPLFIGTRVFALLGYELVEGAIAGDRVREVRRVNFAPDARAMR